MQCEYYQLDQCRSCTWLDLELETQHERKAEQVQEILPMIPAQAWLPMAYGPEAGFRAKAKMVVTGSWKDPQLGILNPDHSGQDLSQCPLYPKQMQELFPLLKTFIRLLRIPPYDVSRRSGELKMIHVWISPDNEFMVRWVLRSPKFLSQIKSKLPLLLAQVPALKVVSVNLLPEHVALTEGAEEIILTPQEHLPMRFAEQTLFLRPGGFFQTNLFVTPELYRQAAAWTADLEACRAVDLFCGVGGFALWLARPSWQVRGIEISEPAVAAAKMAVAVGLQRGTLPQDASLEFFAADASEVFALVGDWDPQVAVVNPPRRGIGPETVAWLAGSGVKRLIYSSCNPRSLAKDLSQLTDYEVSAARIFDLFPHTSHAEVMVKLERK
ncbi:hypothetical protein BK816_02840 [Boudabousia tangfeifanii]|uniref:23S rRNA (Uracil(747)-C(5))-methyltransferase n=1 Tax=Boudabousia tangfeifanii TaxID=1912795 RepID=A0A1D9MJ86_9ACTO|nr:methyltransferase domain-containing protein [Boudabousia tangfeifanii]AOZ72367.1 hypothetical protein BK816_02840 [Boudabousia tangfeifanii]